MADDLPMLTAFRRHSSTRRLAFLAAWVLFWALMLLAAVQDFAREGQRGLWQPLLWEGSSALVGTGLALLQVGATRRLDMYLGRPAQWFARQALWLPLYWFAFIPLVFGIRHGVYALLGQTYRHAGWTQLFLHESTRISIYFGLFTAVLFGIKSYAALADETLRAEQANALLREAQLQQLAQQMQPHFLFNALNTIAALMHSDVERADATLIQLSQVLRANLDLGQRHEAPLADELALARGYAGVMGARFDDRVTIAWDVDCALLDCPVPVMSLQPLLENVFKHTVERRLGAIHVVVSASRTGGTMLLGVEDDSGRLLSASSSASSSSSASGIGLANLRARLRALYGDAAGLVLSERAGGGVRAELQLPCAS